MSERERFFISWRYYRDAAQAWDKALELARSWTATYPREAFAFNSLGSAFLRFGQFEQSVAAFREAIRLDPKFVPAYSNLAAVAACAQPIRRGTGASFSRRPIGSSTSSAPAACPICSPSSRAMRRRWRASWSRSVGVRETNAALGWQGAHLRLRRTDQGRARAVPPRHPDVASGELPGSGGAVDDGRRRDPCDRRTVCRGAAARSSRGSS